MTVSELKWKLRDYDDDTEILIWLDRDEWRSPDFEVKERPATCRQADGDAFIQL